MQKLVEGGEAIQCLLRAPLLLHCEHGRSQRDILGGKRGLALDVPELFVS